MSKTIMRLHLTEAKVRKKAAKAVQPHRDKTKYSRKAKHKGPWDSPQGPFHSTESRGLDTKNCVYAVPLAIICAMVIVRFRCFYPVACHRRG